MQIAHLGAKQVSLRNFRYYDLLVHVFVVVLLISNLVGPKLVAVGPFEVLGFRFDFLISGAQLLFPITYIFGDIFTEVYGYAGSRRAIWLGFMASIIMALMSAFIVWVPAAPGWPHQNAFQVVFGFVPRMVAASLVAFWCGEFANSFVMAKMKVWTEGRMLWARTIGSTVVGQLVDTAVLMVLAFGGVLTGSEIVKLIYSGYLGKVIYEALATPVTYVVVNGLKRAEGVDVYDRGTNFNPFATKV